MQMEMERRSSGLYVPREKRICMAPPFAGVGGYMQATRKSTAAFDPANSSLTGWWRAPYSGAPWAGVASAGASGSRSLATAGSNPSVGATLNGRAGPDFNGSANLLTTSLAGSNFFSAGAMGGWAVVRADSVVADPGAGSRWQGNAIVGDNGATYVQLTMTAAGATLYLTNSGAGDEVTAACSTGAPHLIQFKFDGTNLRLRVDGGSWSNTASTNGPGATIDDLTSTIRVGFQTNYFDGRIWELAFMNTAPADSFFDDVRTYATAYWATAF